MRLPTPARGWAPWRCSAACAPAASAASSAHSPAWRLFPAARTQARPLRVQGRLRTLLVAPGRHTALREAFDGGFAHRAVHVRPVCGATAPDASDHVDRIAAAREILRPALAAFRRAGEVGAALAAAV